MVIALVALIAVGPEQLPSVMRKIGGYAAQVRRMSEGVRSEFMSGMDELDPTNWMGDGSDDKPIVPRGYAESAQATTTGPGSGPKPKSTAADPSVESMPEDPAAEDTASGEAVTEDPEPENREPENREPEDREPQNPGAEREPIKPINSIAAANARPTPVPETEPVDAAEPDLVKLESTAQDLDEELPST